MPSDPRGYPVARVAGGSADLGCDAAEGIAAIDVDGGCTDLAFPGSGTTAHAALLLLDALTERYRDGADRDAVDRELADLLSHYGKYWRKDAVSNPASLRHDVLALLGAMGLVTTDSDGWVRPRPAAGRFAPDVVVGGAVDHDQQALL